jgi:hypothetical protein
VAPFWPELTSRASVDEVRLMTNPTPTSFPSTPWPLWVVGGLSFLWNAGGALNFLMTQTRDEAYMAAFTPEQLKYFYGVPFWPIITWGVATWGSLLGLLLLLLRKGIAVTVFIVSFVSLALTSMQNFVLSNGLEIMGGLGVIIFSAAIFVIGLLLVFCARAMRTCGVLRQLVIRLIRWLRSSRPGPLFPLPGTAGIHGTRSTLRSP